MNEKQVKESVDFLLPIYSAEGLTPTPALLADSIMHMSQDMALMKVEGGA